MIKQCEIIFHIEENKQNINIKVKIEPDDTIIILDALFRLLEQKGNIEIEETKEGIEE